MIPEKGAFNMFEEIVKAGVQLRVKQEVQKAVDQAKLDLERRIPEIVAGVSLELMEYVRMETLQNELVVRISLKKGT